MAKARGKHRRGAPPRDLADAALEAHERAARAMGLCPRLHSLGPDGQCRECTGPLSAIVDGDGLPRRGRRRDDEPPVLVG